MIFGIVFVSVMARNKERLALIEKGANADLFRKKTKRLGALKIGMAAVGIALGILLGFALHANAGMPAEVAMPAMIFLCGGGALMAFYFLSKKLEPNADQE